MKPTRTSLARKLTRRMIRVQLITLALFFGLGVFPTVVAPVVDFLGDAQPLDPRATMVFAHSLVDVEDKQINFVATPELEAVRRDYPSMWLYVRNQSGASATLGEVPPMYRQIEDELWLLESVEVRTTDPSYGSLLVRTEQSPVGTVRVMTGGGPTVGVAGIIKRVSGILALAIVFVLGLASAITIPRIVRREMRGLSAVADQAKLIDINARGTRLSTDGLPDEVQPLVKAVNDGLARLDDSYAKRERFLADSAHELRTPIAILQTRIEMAEPFPEQAQLLVDAARLASLAGQLLDLQRMDLGDSHFEPLELGDMAGNVVGDLAPLAIAAGYELSLNAPDDPVMVDGDSSSLSRALTNVIQNAIAYGGKKGEITVDVGRDGTISVSDDGPGIPISERDRVFEPFYRVKPAAHGAGLGLNLVEAIVRRHHGHITIADAPSGGACIIISLPVLRQAAKKSEPVPAL
ncbi:two-component sensor histidine kinase [Devosia yakushimensis]|uniref:histidine kinase n=1 Tax=Devosia yakushimensis TaxID=470028 RepID=A0ABQ5UGB9_9HYPH|nr:HAMP domain-containing sensor histidine kinase [Devosia yakushimensis]GLQ10437.1 two-component sensor histidine kinase [Devosia yakushimensis]